MMVFLHLSRPSAVMTVLTRSSLAALLICRGSRSSAAKYSCAQQRAKRLRQPYISEWITPRALYLPHGNRDG